MDPKTVTPGIYRIFWHDGSQSVAAVGMTTGGGRWLAPANWVSPTEDEQHWGLIDRMENLEDELLELKSEVQNMIEELAGEDI